MVVTESDTKSQGEVGEVESTLQSAQSEQPKNHVVPLQGRQSSIYSLTLDEFLNSIWIAEENKAQAHPHISDTSNSIIKQPNFSRQGSLTLPPPLCQQTVDEVWSEMQKAQQHDDNNNSNPKPTHRQATLGDMTLEDFLVKAGVVHEKAPPSIPPQQHSYGGLYQNSNPPVVGPSYITRPIIGVGSGGGGGVALYATPLQSGVGVARSFTACPVSSDGMCSSQVKSACQYRLDISGMRVGKKHITGTLVEKVVERRQRRMIKNRESAARARARKQAYTVELETELCQLKVENVHLKQALEEIERNRKKQGFDEVIQKAHTKAEKAKENLRVIRRHLSFPY